MPRFFGFYQGECGGMQTDQEMSGSCYDMTHSPTVCTSDKPLRIR